MLVESVEVIPVPKINFSYTYDIIDYKKRIYWKNYAVNLPFFVNKKQVVPHEELRNSTILLKFNGKYYWCPLYEEIYKAIKGKASKINLKRNLTLKNQMGIITFIFYHQKKEYKTYEVKEIKVM